MRSPAADSVFGRDRVTLRHLFTFEYDARTSAEDLSIREFHWRAVVAVLAALNGCRSVPKPSCVLASGREVWIEVHRPLNPTAPETPKLQVRLVADSTSTRPPSEQQAWLAVREAEPTTKTRWERRQLLTAGAWVGVPLSWGQYVLTINGITYERVTRTVTLTSDEQVFIDVQLRHAEYCLDRPVEVRDES